MKLNKIIILSIIFFLLTSIWLNVKAEDVSLYNSSPEEVANDVSSRAVEIDYSAIANNYNNSPYVQKLKELGIDIKAIQNGNEIVLTYDDTDTITFTFNPLTNELSTNYPLTDRENKDVLAAIMVDTVSAMQGNEIGDQLPFYFDDGLCYSYALTDGVAKEYISVDSKASVSCNIKTNVKMAIPADNVPIDDSTFAIDTENLYSKGEYFTRLNGIIFYKNYSEDGKLEIYIGQSHGLDSYAYKSVLNYLSLLYTNMDFNAPKVLLYMKNNYSKIENGDAEFDGVKIENNIGEFPINTKETILVGNNMQYAKFTIDVDLLKESAADVSLTQPKYSKKQENPKFIVVLVIFSLFILAIIIKLIISIKNRSNKED